MGSFSEREKRLLLATVAILVIGGGYIVFKTVLSGGEGAAVSEATERRFEDLFDKMRGIDDLKAKNLTLKKTMGNEKAQFVSEQEIPKIFAEIEQIAGRSGMQLKGTSQSINQKSRPFPSIEIKIGLEGQFESFIKFFSNLKQSNIVLQPSSMKVALKDKNQPNLDVSMTLTTYFLERRPAAQSSLLLPGGAS